MKRLYEFYEKHFHSLWLQVFIPGGLASIVYITRLSTNKFSALTGIGATILIPLHAFLLGKALKSKYKESEFWKRELERHKWLINSVQEMIFRKINIFKEKGYVVGEEEYRHAVMKNLEMLREFYLHISGDPDNIFRIVFFQPKDDYLIPVLWSTPNGEPPHSVDHVELQKEYFHRSRGQTLAVSALKDLEPKIAEKESEIHYNYAQQREIIKSIIAYPIFRGSTRDENLIGIIVISSSEEGFFRNSDLTRHTDYIYQFAIRIQFEYCKLLSSPKIKIKEE